MAKTLYFRYDAGTTHRGNNDNKLVGTASWWRVFGLGETRGPSVGEPFIASVLGPTAGLEVAFSGVPYEWLSEPLSADFTIAGTITLNLWAWENTMTDNCAINAVIEKLDGATGALTQIAKTARVIEVAVGTPAVNNFTVTPTSTAMKRGDRIRVRIYADDVGTMATGGGMSFDCGGLTAATNGDSYVTFTENLTFELAGDPGVTVGPALGNFNQAFGLWNLASQQRIAQPWTTIDTTIDSVDVFLGKVGAPTDDVVIEIRSDNAGDPSNTVIATVATIPCTSLTTTGIYYRFSGLGISGLSLGAVYWVYIRRTAEALDGSNYPLTWYNPGAIAGWTSAEYWNGTAWAVLTAPIPIRIQADPVSFYHLTDTAESINPGGATEKKALTTRGSGSVNSVTNTAAGPTAGIQTTASAGGTAVEWYTPPLEAITFGGKAKFNVRCMESNANANASLKAEIAVVNGDGTGAVVWGIGYVDGVAYGSGGELNQADTAMTIWVAGDDVAITAGKRLRFRIFAEDTSIGPLVTGYTITVSYNGTTANAAGDTHVILPIVVTEQAAAGPKAITPATINMSGAVSGSVRALRKVTPAGITASFGMGGTVTKVLPVKPVVPTTNVTASFGVSGTVTKTSPPFVYPDPNAFNYFNSADEPIDMLAGKVDTFGLDYWDAPDTADFTPIAPAAAPGPEPVAPAQITASFGMSGTVTKVGIVVKAITPATINVSMAVSANVGARRKITPTTNITATFNVSANVVERQAIRPTTNVTWSSGVSGSIRALRKITPATISATFNTSGVVTRIGAIRPIVPTQVSFTSTVSGVVTRVGALRQITPGTVVFTATVGGVVTERQAISPTTTVTWTSNVSGSIRALRKVTPSQITATFSTSGSVRALRAVKPTGITATFAVNGVVTKRAAVAGAITFTTAISANLTKLVPGKFPTPTTQLTATFSVSGAVIAFKRLTPTTITFTVSTSGAVRALRKVTPSQITFTTSVASAVVVRRAVKPTGITFTANVAGTVRKLVKISTAQVSFSTTVSGTVVKVGTAVIVPTLITWTNGVSGSIRTLRRITPATITTAAQVSGTVRRARGVFPSQVTWTNTVVGRVVKRAVISGYITFTTSVSIARITRRIAIRPDAISWTSTITGTLKISHKFGAIPTVTGKTLNGTHGRINAYGGTFKATGRTTRGRVVPR